jgi:hypothetical protein
MRKPLALILSICVGALAVGCEQESKPAPKVPQADLGAPAKSTTTSTTTTKTK